MWRNLAKRVPRFSIKDLLIIVACCAIGLSTQIDPFLGIASCLLLVELWRQWRFLIAQPQVVDDELQVGLNWARSSRVLCAILLAAMLVHQMLIVQGVLKSPDNDELFFVYPLPFELSTVLLLMALLLTCRGIDHRRGRHLIWNLVLGSIAFLIFVRSVTRELLVPFLVHKATAGVEHSRPLRLQRPGAFPNHIDESFFTTWLAISAATLLVLAAFLLMISSKYVRQHRSVPKSMPIAFATMMCLCLGYVVWYYGWEYNRLSPDMASAGFAAHWSDWLGGILIGLVLITGIAARLSRVDRLETLKGKDSQFEHLQTSVFGLLAVGTLLLSFIVYIWQFMSVDFTSSGAIGSNPILDVIDMLISPMLLLQLVVFLSAFQIAWQWLRNGPPEIAVYPMNPKAFAFNWLALLLLIGIGVPLLNAFAFTFWMGPWSPY